MSTHTSDGMCLDFMGVTEPPPIGLLPREIWRENVENQRINELIAAIIRYRNAGKKCPPQWLDELKALTT